jgi:iron-sulfur cluster insertion protein
MSIIILHEPQGPLYKRIMNNQEFTLTDDAALRIQQIIADQKMTPEHGLRITVEGGGCSGFQYKMDMDDVKAADDHVFKNGPSIVFIDDISMPYLKNSTLEFKSNLGGAMFKINNPNASSSCGCGVSFDMKD